MLNVRSLRLFYSIDEIALTLAECECSSVSDAKSGNYTGWELAEEWQEVIIQHLTSGLLFLSDDKYERSLGFKYDDILHSTSYFEVFTAKLKGEEDFLRLLSPHQLELFLEPLTERVIPTKNITQWAKENGITQWSEQSKDTKHSRTINPQNSTPANDELSPNLIEIQKLLDEKHEYQAQELAIAIKAWLSAIQDPKFNHKAPTQGLDKFIPKEIGTDAARKRIAQVANWDKRGNNK